MSWTQGWYEFLLWPCFVCLAICPYLVTFQLTSLCQFLLFPSMIPLSLILLSLPVVLRDLTVVFLHVSVWKASVWFVSSQPLRVVMARVLSTWLLFMGASLAHRHSSRMVRYVSVRHTVHRPHTLSLRVDTGNRYFLLQGYDHDCRMKDIGCIL